MDAVVIGLGVLSKYGYGCGVCGDRIPVQVLGDSHELSALMSGSVSLERSVVGWWRADLHCVHGGGSGGGV